MNVTTVTEALYYYSDEHVHDRQSSSAFENAQSGWRAEYDAEHDAWDVWTPSGLYRSYHCVTV